MRADARCNRTRILEAATEVLAVSGDTSLRSIARRAGVGQGTLYRHFPTREALVLEVYWEQMEELVNAVPTLLQNLTAPHALRAWLKRLLRVGRCIPDFANSMCAAGDALSEQCRSAYQPLLEALSALVAANEREGTIAPGMTADDVLVLLSPLWRIGLDENEGDREARLFDALMRGLGPSGQDGNHLSH
ncbi:helix-turn-helix domain-containing protein [Streptomyces sp. NPDC093516]|uniref:TetR/AcrR family transcriptional regulator n=1 Tax=Streptomyces sp. NPDC093516 TaxID=3155304 RepID=UPI0034249EA6